MKWGCIHLQIVSCLRRPAAQCCVVCTIMHSQQLTGLMSQTFNDCEYYSNWGNFLLCTCMQRLLLLWSLEQQLLTRYIVCHLVCLTPQSVCANNIQHSIGRYSYQLHISWTDIPAICIYINISFLLISILTVSASVYNMNTQNSGHKTRWE
jgi:hypothetical protein